MCNFSSGGFPEVLHVDGKMVSRVLLSWPLGEGLKRAVMVICFRDLIAGEGWLEDEPLSVLPGASILILCVKGVCSWPCCSCFPFIVLSAGLASPTHLGAARGPGGASTQAHAWRLTPPA